ncbi:proteasome assembly chaperone family protein [Candidatus Woesearchaeota archaeon]|nr:proteasome assembly chaperone family protein [Candidatus Woesearchaeota archaeon]
MLIKINLKKIPKGPTIIEGFPGFGLVGTIATEFMIEHLKAELIGEFVYDNLPATVAIHKSKLVRPMAVYYSVTYNLIILHTILNTKGLEWKVAESIIDFAHKIKAKEIISIEGVGSTSPDADTKVYCFGKKFEELGVEPVSESIIMGVTAAIMLKYPKIQCLFASTHSQLPDSKAAARVIEILDKYLGLKVDYLPLIQQAEEFEKKLRSLIKEQASAESEADKKNMSYLG